MEKEKLSLFVYNELYLDNAPLVHLHHLENEVAVGYLLIALGELTLDFEQQSGKCVGIAFHILEEIVLNLHDTAEVGQEGLGLKDVGVLVEAGVGTLVVIVFVADFAHNLLDDVFHGNQSACTAELVHHNGHMHHVGLEITQEAVNHLCLGHKIGRTDEALI